MYIDLFAKPLGSVQIDARRRRFPPFITIMRWFADIIDDRDYIVDLRIYPRLRRRSTIQYDDPCEFHKKVKCTNTSGHEMCIVDREPHGPREKFPGAPASESNPESINC